MNLLPIYTIMAVNHIRNKKHRNDKPQRKETQKENYSGEFHTKDGKFRYIRGD